MKRAVKTFIALFFAAFICIYGCMTAFAWDHDETWMGVKFQNALEGTAYVDLLLKDNGNDSTAVDYNEEYEKYMLGLGEDRVSLKRGCGLAKYNEDGYTSMTLRHNFVVFYDTYSDEASYDHMKMKTRDIFNQHRYVKLAYCDRDGNVIKVTDEIKVPYNSFTYPVMYWFSGDGERLSFKFGGVNQYQPWSDILIICVPIALLIFGFVLVRILIKRSKAKKAECEQ